MLENCAYLWKNPGYTPAFVIWDNRHQFSGARLGRVQLQPLVGILESSGMLCPISALAKVEDPEDCTENEEGEEMGLQLSRYIVPFHLKEKCLKGKWERLCRKTWIGICNSDKILTFDFRNFLPPALFHYFIVRTGAKSKSSNGMRPIIAKEMAIFSFGDSFFILTEACQKFNQIKISARQVNIF